MGEQKTPYQITIQLPIRCESDEQALAHAKLVMRVLQPLRDPHLGYTEPFRARLEDVGELPPRIIHWEKK
jgi:hypothetical protein